MRMPKLATLLCALFVFSAGGCDPIRTTLQPVRLQIVNSASGEPVAGTQIWLKYDFEHAEPLSQAAQQYPAWDDPEKAHQFELEQWDQRPWSTGLTDKYGQAYICIEYTRIDHTLRIVSKPPSCRDEVSGKPHLVKIEKGQVREEFSLVMQPNASVQGKSFTVTILEIQEPRYIKTR